MFDRKGSYKVRRIQYLKNLPNAKEAKAILERVANDVEPVMRNHRWRVKLLSEFLRTDRLGENEGEGKVVRLVLRKQGDNNEFEFRPYKDIRCAMLHELCHNVYYHHDANFLKLMATLIEETGFELTGWDALHVHLNGSQDSGSNNHTYTDNGISNNNAYNAYGYSRIPSNHGNGGYHCSSNNQENGGGYQSSSNTKDYGGYHISYSNNKYCDDSEDSSNATVIGFYAFLCIFLCLMYFYH